MLVEGGAGGCKTRWLEVERKERGPLCIREGWQTNGVSSRDHHVHAKQRARESSQPSATKWAADDKLPQKTRLNRLNLYGKRVWRIQMCNFPLLKRLLVDFDEENEGECSCSIPTTHENHLSIAHRVSHARDRPRRPCGLMPPFDRGTKHTK